MRSVYVSAAARTAALVFLLAPASVAQEVVLQNDSFMPGDAVGFQSLFITGEAGAVRLTPPGPSPLPLTKVRFLFGGAAGEATITLQIWDDAAGTVTPGTPLFSADYVLTASDTVLHEIDLSAAALMVSGPFRVGIEMHQAGLPSIARDTDGTVATGRNFVRDTAGEWFDASSFLAGDLVIRAVVGSTDVTLFEDNFESGDLLAWSEAVTDGGDLSVADAAALAGTSSGLRAIVNDTAPLFVADTTPVGLGRYRARFYFDPHGFDPGESQNHRRTRLFIVFDESPLRRLAAVVLRRLGGDYALMGRVRRDDNSQASTAFVSITDDPHWIEIDWKQSAPDANDGGLEMWIDGVLAGSLGGIDNDAGAVDFVRLGALSVKPGAAGTLYFDEFVSRDNEFAIGP